MRLRLCGLWVGALLLFPVLAAATIFGNIRGIIHDPQHRPIEGATVTLHALNSGLTQVAMTELYTVAGHSAL